MNAALALTIFSLSYQPTLSLAVENMENQTIALSHVMRDSEILYHNRKVVATQNPKVSEMMNWKLSDVIAYVGRDYQNGFYAERVLGAWLQVNGNSSAKLESTTYEKAEYGKYLCVSGNTLIINRVWDGYTGILLSSTSGAGFYSITGGNVYKGDSAKFCGIVIGKRRYKSNCMDISVMEMVGEFDNTEVAEVEQ